MANRGASKKAKKQAYKLDYSLVPEPESKPTFTSLPQELEAKLQKLPRTLGRMRAALMACAEMDGSKPEGPRAQLKAGTSFRAALTEFVAIEDTLNRELPPGEQAFRLLNTENPLPHILKLLRNLQVHYGGSEMSDSTISLWLKNVPGAVPVDVTVWIIGDLSGSQLLDLDAFKIRGEYAPAQATEMADWVTARQTVFGIGDIIYRGVVEAAERIAAAYVA